MSTFVDGADTLSNQATLARPAVVRHRSAAPRRSRVRGAMAGPTVWDNASLEAWDYMIAVNPRQAEACLRIREGLRRRNRRLDTIEASDFQEPALRRTCACGR